MPTLPELLQHGIARHQAGDLATAEKVYRAILAQLPDQPDALHALGILHQQQGDHATALAFVERAVERAPQQAHFLFNLAKMYAAAKRSEEAVNVYQRVISLQPDQATVHECLGLELYELNRIPEALAPLERAVALDPHNDSAWSNLGLVHKTLGNLTKATECLLRAIELSPENAAFHTNLGAIWRARKEYPPAIACYERALQLKPGFVDALNNLGNVYLDEGDVDSAGHYFTQALQGKPDYYDAFYNLANVYRAQGRFPETIAACEQMLRQNPDNHDVHSIRALLRLLFCDWQAGWDEFEWRWKFTPPIPYAQPWWNGENISGKSIVLWSEQGLGDTIQFIRYAPLLKAQGARVVVMCQPPLVPILRQTAGVDELHSIANPPPPCDFQLPLMSLPRVFRTELNTIPAPIPYLQAESDRIERWRAALQAIPGKRIGIVWQGNPDYTSDKNRSLPLAYFAPLAAIPGVSLISLQFGPGLEQLRASERTFPVFELGERDLDGAFLDTAAILKNLDLLVASDTSIVHLAGALGVPTCVLLGVSPNWRWHFGHEVSPWYPTLRLYRQTKYRDWSPVIAQVVRDVTEWMRR